jgi:hypothetical protein
MYSYIEVYLYIVALDLTFWGGGERKVTRTYEIYCSCYALLTWCIKQTLVRTVVSAVFPFMRMLQFDNRLMHFHHT